MPETSWASRSEYIFNFTRFDGGYFTNLADAEMQTNEMLTAENCEWDEGLRKRRGLQIYATVSASITIRGAIRAYIAGAWRTIVAKDLGSSTVLHHAATALSAWASVNMPTATAFTLQAGYDTQFAVIGERVVGVNGYDEPFVIREAGGSICADTIERYDTRIRDNDNWAAGQLHTGGGTYTDDTTNAQDVGADDFVMMTTTASTGFFIGCDFTFNKLVFTNVSTTGSIPFVFQYFGYPSWGASATWNTIGTSSMIQTTNWSTTTNTLTMEWPVPFISEGSLIDVGFEKLPDMGSADSFLGGKYAVRLYTTAAAEATVVCDIIAVQHSQYLSQLLLNDKPDTVVQHKNHIFMGMGNWLRYSVAQSPEADALKGWRDSDMEPFESGGKIKQMVSHNNYLAVLLEDAVYGITGNSWDNWALSELAHHGSVSKRGAAVVDQYLYFVSEDGIWQWSGSVLTNVTKGLKTDIDSFTLTDAAAVEYNGELWVAFPTNGNLLKADPDTYREDSMGNARLSFYKFSNYRMDGWLYCRGDSDIGYLLGWANNAQPAIMRADVDTVDFVTSTASINWSFRSANLSFEDEARVKQYRRFKPILADMASAATATDTKCLYQFTFINKNAYGSTTANATVTVSACSNGIFETDLTLPHTMDGKRLSVFMAHTATCTAKLYGFSIGARRRWF